MYIYKSKLDGRKLVLLEYLKDWNAFVEIEKYGSVVRNDKGYSRERWKLLQDALCQKILFANNSLHSLKSFYVQIFLNTC